jgi:hypothetical protein
MAVTAKHILAAFAIVFFTAAMIRLARDHGTLPPQSRAWLLIAVIFALVSAWLWWRG